MQVRLTIFLLIYWGLLVNLGPSVHTHSIFGLHGSCCSGVHHTESSGATLASLQSSDSCCCCCSHTEDQTSELADSEQLAATDEVKTHHHCTFCEFFKYLSATPATPHLWVAEQSIEISFSKLDGFLSTDQVCSRARGPPQLVS